VIAQSVSCTSIATFLGRLTTIQSLGSSIPSVTIPPFTSTTTITTSTGTATTTVAAATTTFDLISPRTGSAARNWTICKRVQVCCL
jgi:hypothetical protein